MASGVGPAPSEKKRKDQKIHAAWNHLVHLGEVPVELPAHQVALVVLVWPELSNTL